MLVKTEAIVLHAIKFGESRLIVDMFTREVGRVSFAVPIPKTSKGRLKKQYFQPMTLLEVECDVRQRDQLQKLKDARLLAAYASIPFSPEKLALSLFTAEFLCHALRAEQQNLLHTFLIRMSRFLGFYPNLDDYVRGCIFDLRTATFSLQVPTHRDFLQPDDAQRIHTLMRMDFPTMHLFRLSRQERNRITEVLLHYYQLHIPQFPELKSLDVLKELWT